MNKNLKYAIYGVNRVSKDFLYIFDDLNIIECFASENENADDFKKIFSFPARMDIEIAANRRDFDAIIVCDFDKADKTRFLNNLGYKYGRDYFYEEGFFDDLDENIVNPENRPLLIWGCGRKGEAFIRWNKWFPVEKVIDSYSKEDSIHGYKIVRPGDISDWSKYFVVVSVVNNKDIIDFLSGMNLKPGIDFCEFNDFVSCPSRMLRQTIFESQVYDFNCTTMLNHAEIGHCGDMICCCSTFIDNHIGMMNSEHSFSFLWKSNIHKVMCLSNVNRTYSFCRTDMCPLFIGRSQSTDYRLSVPYEKMEETPRTVAVGFDYTCNLKCITCREEYRFAEGAEKNKIQQVADAFKSDVLPGCEFLIMAGDGEVLMSKAYQSIYDSSAMKNIKYFRLLTNGLLFTPEKWQELRSHTDAKIMMTVSIDAATPKTYEKIRRGGRWNVLQKNMEYAAHLRSCGELSYLRFNFVVQRMNYREMPLFVKWGRQLGIDEVFFTKILNWGTYSKSDFKLISMMEEDGITPKPELEEILNDPIMKNKIVDLGTIKAHHEAVQLQDIDNYYRWELERKVGNLFDTK